MRGTRPLAIDNERRRVIPVGNLQFAVMCVLVAMHEEIVNWRQNYCSVRRSVSPPCSYACSWGLGPNLTQYSPQQNEFVLRNKPGLLTFCVGDCQIDPPSSAPGKFDLLSCLSASLEATKATCGRARGGQLGGSSLTTVSSCLWPVSLPYASTHPTLLASVVFFASARSFRVRVGALLKVHPPRPVLLPWHCRTGAVVAVTA